MLFRQRILTEARIQEFEARCSIYGISPVFANRVKRQISFRRSRGEKYYVFLDKDKLNVKFIVYSMDA